MTGGIDIFDIYKKLFINEFETLLVAVSLNTTYSLPKVKTNELIVKMDRIRKNVPASSELSLVEMANVKRNPIMTEMTLILPEIEYPIKLLKKLWLRLVMRSSSSCFIYLGCHSAPKKT